MPIGSLTPPPTYNPPPISAGVPPRALGTAERIGIERAAKAHDEPPVEALEAVRVAAKAYEQLRATARELHFESTDSGVRIEVYDAEGELIRRIPPNEALAIASGEGTWLA